MNPYRTGYDAGDPTPPPRWYRRRVPNWVSAIVIGLAVMTGGVQAATNALRINGAQMAVQASTPGTATAANPIISFDTTATAPRLTVDNGSGRSDVKMAVIDVKEYGAKGDGVTNDTTTVQAAITAAGTGGRVYFPPGNYLITSTLTTPTFVTLEGPTYMLGAGIPAATQLKFTTGSSTLITAGTNITIKNLFLEGPGTGTAVSSATHMQCDHAQFDNWAVGVNLNGSFYTRMNECEFHADAIAIQATSVYNLDLYGVITRLCPQSIVVTDRIAALNIYGGSFEGWTSAAAIVPGANSLINVVGAYFESSVAATAGTIIKNNGTQNTFNLIGNQIYLTEASKWFDGNAKDLTTLYARGNKFIAAVGSSVTPTAYTLGINATGGSVDIADEDWTGVLKVGSVFISGGVTAGYLSTVDTTGVLTLTPGAASTINTVGGAVKAASIDASSASTFSLATATANAIAIGRSGITTTLTGALTQLTGALSLTGNAASSVTTSSGALTLTSAAAATWDTGGGTVNSAAFDVTTSGGALGLGNTRAGPISVGSSGNTNLITARSNNFTFSGNAISSGVPTPYNFGIGAYTNITASSEQIDVDWNLATARTWLAGNFALNRTFRIRQPVYQAASASTITDAVTFDVVGAPNCTSNMTCTNKWAVRVEAGGVGLGDATVAQATNVNTNVTVNGATMVITSQTATTAARTAETGFTVTNSAVAAASSIICGISDYSGTVFTNGQPDVSWDTIAAGSFKVHIINRDATNALNGTMKIHCHAL